MNLHKLILTNNDCYKAGKYITVKGIMVHSTGANNPWLKRYVNPDDGLLGKNQYNNHWNQPTPAGQTKKCVHAFIGKLADGTVATYQTLPWDMRGWHSASGSKGAAHDTHIGFEICEDDLTDPVYFNAVYKEAVELCAYLCKMFKLDPLGDGVIIGHYEGYLRGIASNHGDPKTWFSKHGKSMTTFRNDVKTAMGQEEKTVKYYKILGNEVMNLRETAPNGKIIMPIPTGTIISGDEFLTASNGTIWMKTQYNGRDGWVAVAPAGKGYCEEVPAPKPTPEPDYKAQYELQKARADMLELENKNLKADNEKVNKEIVILQSEYDKVIKDIKNFANKY